MRDEDGSPSGESVATANPGYALGQLARALTQSASLPDAAARERAARKAESFLRVFSGMLSGALAVGSRTPVAGTPAWATLRVVTGGFATGELLASGPLVAHELALAERLQLPVGPGLRAALNAYFLSEAGFAELRALLDGGGYRVEVPEEGALLTVAWLVAHRHLELAQDVLTQIGPYLSQLRFYPAPHPRPLSSAVTVHVRTVAEAIQGLAALHDRPELAVQREALTIWNPFLDRLVALFAETVTGAPPAVEIDGNGKPLRHPDGSWVLSGGWPCQRYAPDWSQRAARLLDDYTRHRAAHRLCKKPERAKENLAQLLGFLRVAARDPRSLSGRDVGRIRMILAHIAASRGLPSSERSQALRREQERQAELPTKVELSRALIDRLRPRRQDEGLESPDAIAALLAPLNETESQQLSLPAGYPLPSTLRPHLLRCLEAPVETLVELGVITSAETLARVLPQLSAAVGAAGIAEPALARLYGAIYQAFRRRRSLLLLNYERQVRIEELPWVAALASFRKETSDTRLRARTLLAELVLLALTSFPHMILPNKLLQEIRALAERAGLKLPIVDEVAADIFMGEFTEKYLRAAQLAAALLRGTLYETYYGLPYEAVLQIDDVPKSGSKAAPLSAKFGALCRRLAGVAEGPAASRFSVANNGRILEQEQILTTHNLATLVGALQLLDALRPRLFELAERCFVWICRMHQIRYADWRPRLHMVKNTAYAFRQLVFFLSLLPKGEQLRFHAFAVAHLGQQSPDFQLRFAAVTSGLRRAIDGQSPDAPPGSRRFLGWSTKEDQAWLLPPLPAKAQR